MNWSFKEIAGMDPFTSIGKYFIYYGYKEESPRMNLQLCNVHELGWNSSSVIRGLNRIQELGDLSGKKVMASIVKRYYGADGVFNFTGGLS